MDFLWSELSFGYDVHRVLVFILRAWLVCLLGCAILLAVACNPTLLALFCIEDAAQSDSWVLLF